MRGRVDDVSFWIVLVHFIFLLIKFHWTFSISYKIWQIMFIIIVFWFGSDRPSGLLFFVSALLLSLLKPLFLPSSSVALSYFILDVPMRECLRKRSCMSPPFPIGVLNGIPSFNAKRHGRRVACQNLMYNNNHNCFGWEVNKLNTKSTVLGFLEKTWSSFGKWELLN